MSAGFGLGDRGGGEGLVQDGATAEGGDSGRGQDWGLGGTGQGEDLRG